MKKIYLAGGCFWGLQKYMSLIQGVKSTSVGYANGIVENPSYEEVYTGRTGHAETVEVIYDESRIGLEFLLRLYFEAINPTTLNRQGNDIGKQYRSGIYYVEPNDLPVIQEEIGNLNRKISGQSVIEVEPLLSYYLAEEYHQDYLDKNPNGYCHIGPDLFRRAKNAKYDQAL
ncbi:MAG: peptide-methionine (S)-S-oxide reductase MsrA [Clostridiaceae bacterium]|nr:peptide-methionine (S)-S-oxide reductase MsrA [Clostridiaceae bacterium]